MRKCYQIVFSGWELAEPEARETGVGAIGKWGRERELPNWPCDNGGRD